MNFVSFEFLAVFPLVFLGYWILPQKYRTILLLIVSYLFYIYWNKWAALFFLGTTVLSYMSAIYIARQKKDKRRKLWFLFALVVNLGCLFWFKYLGFFTWNITTLFHATGILDKVFVTHVLLPVGISFHTFQTLAYVIDVYKKQIEPEYDFIYFALYVSYFPQLVAGPIERPSALLPQLHAKHSINRNDLMIGFQFMLRGYIKKLVIADFFAPYVEQVYARPLLANGPGVVLATILFAFQIYCDFSGYSDIAVGCARMMGIHLTQNFASPYTAVSIRDFWRRWHISLSSWFMDYVYKPLGGSRGKKSRQCFNIMVVFLLSGLWHGAHWNYVIWGMIHGIYLVCDILFLRKLKCKWMIPEFIMTMVTFLEVCFAWIFFRSASLTEALILVRKLITGWSFYGITDMVSAMNFSVNVLARIILSLLCLKFLKNIPKWNSLNEKTVPDKKDGILSFGIIFECIVVIALAWISLLAANVGSSFIYFQF